MPTDEDIASGAWFAGQKSAQPADEKGNVTEAEIADLAARLDAAERAKQADDGKSPGEKEPLGRLVDRQLIREQAKHIADLERRIHDSTVIPEALLAPIRNDLAELRRCLAEMRFPMMTATAPAPAPEVAELKAAHQSSVELKRDGKGAYSWAIKVYNDDLIEATRQARKIDAMLKDIYPQT